MRSPRFSGIKTSLVAWSVLIVGVTTIGFSATLYHSFQVAHQQEFDVALYNFAIDIGHSVHPTLFGVRLNTANLTVDEKLFPFALRESLIQIRDFDGHSIGRSSRLGSSDLPYGPADLERLASERMLYREISVSKDVGRQRSEKYRMLDYALDKPGSPSFIIQVAAPMDHWNEERVKLFAFFATAIPVILMIAILGGLFLAHRALAPVRAMVRKADGIGAGNLSERVPMPEGQDEIHALGRTLNNLLARLEEAFRSQEQFVADASHQLKTPLAVLNGELELVACKERSKEEMATALCEAKGEVDGLIRIVNNLLTLARADLGAHGLTRETLRVDELVTDVACRLERVAKIRAISVRVDLFADDPQGEAPFELSGEGELLRCLFENIIENAIKYSPEGGLVRVDVRDDAGRIRILVSDEGPGIPVTERERVFERFHRAPGARQRAGGTGLGLSIARKIAVVHEGSIAILDASREGGAQFVIELPKAARF